MRKFEIRQVIAATALVFAIALPLRAFADEWKLTLEQAVSRALEENRDIAIARERLEELEGMKGEARAMGLPQVAAVGSYQRTWRKPQMIINGLPFRIGTNNNFVAGGQLSQLLWDGGRVFKAIKAARSEQARGIETIRDAEEQVRFQVKQTFFQILYTDKVIDVLLKELGQLKSHLASIQTRYSAGQDSDYTLMRQQVEVANIEPQLIDARRTRELLVGGIKILMAIPPADGFVPTGGFDYHAKNLPAQEELIGKAQTERPDLNAERLRVKSLEQNVGVEKAGWWPQLSFSTSWQWQGYSDDLNVTANERTDSFTSGVAMTWPIFDGLKTASRVKQARARLMQQSYLASQKQDEVAREAQDARETLLRARETLQSQLKSFQLARRATAIASERFESGLMSQLELNDTITSQARSEQLYLQATYDCLTAEAALEKAVGGEIK
ncbi:MAG: TolC family protein [Pseudomonadota bacterium]